MQVILTHEQADFDAIASVLGAYLLKKDAYPVLPGNMNRNVRNFLHLYTSELPFRKKEHLPRKPINSIILVDTQSLVTLKGLSKDCAVEVVDHHQKKADLPIDWHYHYIETGACTTHFVEQIQENNGELNIVHATLLLLGIYEDTGSLSYASTTSRDARAVAYLLENGASLKIASEFLNPPLSAEQREVFESLLENLEIITIQDCRIILSKTSAPMLEDEVSTIAHKMVDLYDPDGLFIFVETHEGIRLVARSITDQINVAEITAGFGGGGHKRAAAALIKHSRHNKNQLADLYDLFKRELSDHVKPGITVKQIMSKKPLTILPDTTAEQALNLMQRFGYEGYPVVEGNKIKGLLTRRAVDRAISHQLNLPASRLMEAGTISVSPYDSLEHLQRVMADSGWGQVPVVDPDSNEIIGIATRTDLLKTLAGKENSLGGRINLSTQIISALPPSHLNLLKAISIVADRLNVPIYLVGGFARDLMLKSPSLDLDFVVEGDAIQLAEALSREFGGKVTSHRKFGTAKWLTAGIKNLHQTSGKEQGKKRLSELPAAIDLISARTEYYEKPTALPTVKKSSIKLDLLRRDFTINTMAVRVDGAHFGDLYDYWGGLNDLNKGIIRVLHSLSFVDDPTRVLRAVRFEQRFGFSIEERTLELLEQAKDLLDEVSGDRVRHELDQIMKEERAAQIFNRLFELNLLNHILPSFSWDEIKAHELQAFLNSDFPIEWNIYPEGKESIYRIYGAYIVLFSKLSEATLEAILHRLRFKNHLRRMLIEANRLWSELDQINKIKPSQMCRLLDSYTPLAIYCVYFLADDPKIRAKLSNYILKWRPQRPFTTGTVLKEMGLKPGPQYREILDHLRFAWVDGEISSQDEEREELIRLVERYYGLRLSL